MPHIPIAFVVKVFAHNVLQSAPSFCFQDQTQKGRKLGTSTAPSPSLDSCCFSSAHLGSELECSRDVQGSWTVIQEYKIVPECIEQGLAMTQGATVPCRAKKGPSVATLSLFRLEICWMRLLLTYRV